jgi:hypothetical protein
MELTPQIRQIINTSMTLLNEVKNQVPVEEMTKDFWLQLGMLMAIYQSSDLVKPEKMENAEEPTSS